MHESGALRLFEAPVQRDVRLSVKEPFRGMSCGNTRRWGLQKVLPERIIKYVQSVVGRQAARKANAAPPIIGIMQLLLHVASADVALQRGVQFRLLAEVRFRVDAIVAALCRMACRAGCERDKSPQRLEVVHGSDTHVGERPVGATLLNWRKKTDIALLAIKADLPGLTTTVLTPQAAWAMSLGFPWEFEEAVPLIGHVIDDDSTGLWVQMVTQPGSSGAPLVNAQGQVMGTVVGGLIDEGEDYTVGWTSAVPTDALCGAMFECDQVSVTQPSDDASSIE